MLKSELSSWSLTPLYQNAALMRSSAYLVHVGSRYLEQQADRVKTVLNMFDSPKPLQDLICTNINEKYIFIGSGGLGR